MLPVARLGDMHICPIHGASFINSASSVTSANRLGAACVGEGVQFFPQTNESLAQLLADHLRINVRAYIRRSDYKNTWGTFEERQLGKLCGISDNAVPAEAWCKRWLALNKEREDSYDKHKFTYQLSGATYPVFSGETPLASQEVNLNFYRSKLFWIAAAVLLIAGYYELKAMMSVYKTDFGNGVIVYADDYVKTGRWVFDCEYTRLISREPLPVPFSDLERTEEFDIWDGYLKREDQQPAKEALAAITSVPHWYRNLRYLYSGLDDNSGLSAHRFHLIAEHAGRSWVVSVRQSLSYYGKTQGFTLSIEPYDPETYVDYDRAFQAAIKSCPAPQ